MLTVVHLLTETLVLTVVHRPTEFFFLGSTAFHLLTETLVLAVVPALLMTVVHLLFEAPLRLLADVLVINVV